MSPLTFLLCVVTVIQVTSSQSTYDVIQQNDDASYSCGRTDVLDQLMSMSSQHQSAMTQLQTIVSQLCTVVSQLHVANSHLQRDIAALKAAAAIHEGVTGTQEKINKKSTGR